MKRGASLDGRFREILCPVDFSSHSRRALQYAAAVAGQSGARLTVLLVTDPLLAAGAAAAAYDVRALAKSSETDLRQFVRRAIAGSRLKASSIDYRIAVGDPAAEIDKSARRLKADLVVMGTHGLTGARTVFFGSTAEKFLRRATVPVLLIPRRITQATGGAARR